MSETTIDNARREILFAANGELNDWLHFMRERVAEGADGTFERLAPVMFERMLDLSDVLACGLDTGPYSTEKLAATVNRKPGGVHV